MHAMQYNAGWLASQPPKIQNSFVQSLSARETATLLYDWSFWAREKQLPPPGDWRFWLLLAGRGFGKTRAITEFARLMAEAQPGSRGALVASTASDVRDVLIEGESGILNISPPWFMPKYEPSKRRLTWTNGSIATTYSADEPDRLRGPQHHWGAVDELAAWRRPEAWDMFLMGLRLGHDPRAAIATTPRPTPAIKKLLDDPTVAVTRGTTYENRANLAPVFFETIIRRYEGTRLGRQELLAEILTDVPGALWKRDDIDKARVNAVPDLARVVVGVDPAVTANEDSDETGIIVAGIDGARQGYMQDDVSLRASPQQWAATAVRAYYKYAADALVCEVNNGGDMVEYTIKTVDPNVRVIQVRASRGKYTRAEPIAALYEQGRVHHVGEFATLEDQMCTWVPGEKSPDRMDALVWAFTELALEPPALCVA